MSSATSCPRDHGGIPLSPLSYPFSRSDMLQPPSVYEELRGEHPVATVVLPGGSTAYLVTRYNDVCTVLEDRRFSRAAVSKAGSKDLVAYAPPAEPVDPRAADHSIPYDVVNRWFTVRGVERLRPRTQQVTDMLLDEIEASTPPVDLISMLASELPMTVIGELVGIPEPDRPWVRDRAPLVTVDSPTEESRTAAFEVAQYFERLIEERRTHRRTDDLLSVLVTAHEEDPKKLPEDKIIPLAMRTCLPGFHSVAVTLGKSIPILLRQPEVYAELRRQPELVAPVVEELLRMATPAVTSLPRLALEEVELSGVRIPANSVVIACLESANMDDGHYPCPERILPDRGDRRHTTFGLGSNFCFGAALSRMELQVVIGTLAIRLPTLKLAVPEDELLFRSGVIAPDVLKLPVLW
ncbi:cytochrome P450 [Streptomyces hokutonensis]|uniref:cytochrome P450 n=1 Tax=Streptomyces hokutonensis TaxID=1306990 RepID=UPI0038074CCF